MSYVEEQKMSLLLSQPTEYSFRKKLPSDMRNKQISIRMVCNEQLPNDLETIKSFSSKATNFVQGLPDGEYVLLSAGNQVFNLILTQILCLNGIVFSILYYHGGTRTYKEIGLVG